MSDRQPPAPPEPASREDLGLTKQDTPETHKDDPASIAEKGEPFDDNFA